MTAPSCTHARVRPWKKGTRSGGPHRTTTVDRKPLFRSFSRCLDCGTLLERAEPKSLRWGFTDRKQATKIVGRLRWKTDRSGARVQSTPRNMVNYDSTFRDSQASSRTPLMFRDELIALARSVKL